MAYVRESHLNKKTYKVLSYLHFRYLESFGDMMNNEKSSKQGPSSRLVASAHP